MTRTLIFGSSYIENEAKLEFVRLWGRLVDFLNPGIDIVVIDSASPLDPAAVLPSRFNVHRFPDNIGPISRGYRDGAGRALCKGMELAIEGKFDFCVHLEADFVFVHCVMNTVNRMARAGVKVAACYQPNYQFLEWGLSFFSVPYLKETKFIERYDWPNAPFFPIPEWRLEHLTADDLFVLPYRGMRNDHGQLNVSNIGSFCPYVPFDFLHHVDILLAQRLIDSNRIVLP